MGLTLQVKGDKMGCGLCGDLTDRPGGVVGEVRGKDTNPKLTLQVVESKMS